MSLTFDFSELVEDRKKIEPKLKNRVNDLIYKHSIEMYKRILKRTPYCSGKLINGWEYEPKMTADGWAYVRITNEVVYAEIINSGDVDSDGAFMVELSVAETQQNLDRDLRRPKFPVLKDKKPQPPRADSISKVPDSKCKNP